jgi:hypothetical protein
MEKMVTIEKSLGVPECKGVAIKGKFGFSENGQVGRRQLSS